MKKYLCFDIGGLSLKYSVYDMNLKEYYSGQFKYDLASHFEIWKKIREIYLNIREEFSLNEIAISSSGIVSEDHTKITLVMPNSKKSKIYMIKNLLNLEDVNVKIDNDARCALRAEKLLGAAVCDKNVIMYTIGTALGGAICIENKIINGSGYSAGEIGCGYFDFHNKKNISQETGMYGLMEAHKNKTGIWKDAKEIWNDAQKDANSIDEYLINKQINNISSVITNTAIFLDVSLVIIGGAVSTNNFFIERITKRVKEQFLKTNLEFKLKIKPSKYLNDAGKIGALLLYK